MNILAIGAHPDDIEFGCGGTLIRLADEGHKVYLLVMSEGITESEQKIRKQEQLESAEIMKAEELFFGGYQDTSIKADKQLVMFIESILNKIKPEMIFANYFDDTHQDHRHLAKGVLSATRYIKNVLFYEGPTTQNFNPTLFEEIEDYQERKILCLNAHNSQVTKTNIKDLSIIELSGSCAIFRGIQARVKCAEGFVPLRFFLSI